MECGQPGRRFQELAPPPIPRVKPASTPTLPARDGRGGPGGRREVRLPLGVLSPASSCDPSLMRLVTVTPREKPRLV